jgi:predicted  nucleic acid-binding Zn-ribbon protein
LGWDTILDEFGREKTKLFNIQQQAWQKQDNSLKAYQELNAQLSPKIAALTEQHDALYEKMVSFFQEASAAYHARCHPAAKQNAAMGHDIQAQLVPIVEERRELVEQIKNAETAYISDKNAFIQARSNFRQIKTRYDERLAYAKEQGLINAKPNPTVFKSKQQRDDPTIMNHYFNSPGDGPKHGHVQEKTHEDGTRTYPFVRDENGTEYKTE